jgi:hypothetical protein
MPKMPEGAWRDFLTSKPRTGKLATVRKDGAPHVMAGTTWARTGPRSMAGATASPASW